MKRALVLLGSFAAVAVTLAMFVALAAAIVFIASAPERARTRAAVHHDFVVPRP